MYHYKESGLPHVYLVNGYKEIVTPNGKAVVINDVEGLHLAIAYTAVTLRKHLTGPEVRFIRKYLEQTQAQFAELLGVEEQTVRLWEKRPRAPKAADRAVRLLFLNMIDGSAAGRTNIAEIVHNTEARPEVPKISLRFKPRARHDKWGSDLPLAA